MSGIARWRNVLGVLGLVTAVLVVPQISSSSYVLSVGIFIGIYGILTIGLVLLIGYAGQVSLGHAAFYGMGAYGSAILTTTYGWSVVPAAAAAALVTAGFAALLGAPILRLTGDYLAMATLALGIIIYVIFNEFFWLTGGPSGLRGIPRMEIFGWVVRQETHYFYLVWGVVVGIVALSLNLVNSRVGRAMRAIHTSQVAAETVGVPATRLKVQIFALSAFYASLAGSLYAHYITFVNPPPFGVLKSVMLVVMAVVGGLASIWGALVGAAVITLFGETLRQVLPRFSGGAVSEQEIIIFGILLVVVMIFTPQGLVPAIGSMLRRITRPRGGASPSHEDPPDPAHGSRPEASGPKVPVSAGEPESR
jgi:branched-chain amino acid transport system permease protein